MSARPWIFLVGLAELAGCAAGPDYHRPALMLPNGYVGAPATAGPNRLGAPAALPTADLARWWEALHDSELNSLVNRAVAANWDLLIALDRLQQSRALLDQGFGQALPNVAGSGVSGHGTGNNFARGGSIDGPLAQAVNTSGLKAVSQVLGVDAGMEIDVFGHVRRELEALRGDAEAAAEVRHQVLVTVVGDVTRTYLNVRTLHHRLAIAGEALGSQRHAADLAQQRYQRGITNELDAALAARELETTAATLEPLRAQLGMAERNLALLLGLEPDALQLELAADFPVPLPPAAVATGLPIDLLRRRPDIRQAEAQLVAANARLGVATSMLYPRFFLTGAAGVETEGVGFTPDYQRGIWSVAPSFSWPLFDAGTVDANILAHDEATRARAAQFRKTVLAAIGQVEDSLASFAAEQSRLDHLRSAEADANRAVRLATQRYDRGIIDYLNVLDAQRSLYSLQDQAAVSANQAAGDFVAVCQSLGGGWEGWPPPAPLRHPLPALLAAVRELSGSSQQPSVQ